MVVDLDGRAAPPTALAKAARERHAHLRRRRLGPHPGVVRPTSSTSWPVPRLPAQRDRGDGLHPHRHRARRALRRSPSWCRWPWSPGAPGARSPSTRPPASTRTSRRCRVDVLDATGAGDVFGAELRRGPARRLAARPTGSPSPPCAPRSRSSSSAAPWPRRAGATSPTGGTRCATPADGGSYHAALVRRFAFLEQIVPTVPVGAVRRAAATIARQADLEVAP